MQRVFRATLAKDVEQVWLTRLHGPACHLQVVEAEGNRLYLLPLVVKHVDSGLVQRCNIESKVSAFMHSFICPLLAARHLKTRTYLL